MKDKINKKILSIVSIFLLFMVSFTILGGTERSFDSIKKGVLELFAKNTDGSPLHEKTLIDNGDGTYKLSLNVTGESEKTYTNANVIVVFDVSGSMTDCANKNDAAYSDGTCIDSSKSRLPAAKNAVNGLANSLLSKNTTDHPNTIEMALVSFSDTARIAREKTNSYSTFSTAVNGLTASGGTNWEAALQTALRVNFNDKDQTYVIFVSDGNPTRRLTAGGYTSDYDRWTGVYGTGYEDKNNIERCYNQATDDASQIVKNGYEFFTIGVYGNVDRMENLTVASGKTKENYYSATNTAALQSALNDILEKIERAGFGGVSINDGTTKQVTAKSGKLEGGMLEVDESSYDYKLNIPVTRNEDGTYKYDDTYTISVNGSDITITWKDSSNNNKSATYTGKLNGNNIEIDWNKATDFSKIHPNAELKDGEVEWNLESLGVLLNDVTYTITFDVYPSQVTLDLIADLKNNPNLWENLDKSVRDSLVKVGNDYKLRTNTNATILYTDTRTSAGKQTKPYDNPNPVSTVASEMMAVSKEFQNYINPEDEVQKLDLYVDRGEEVGHYKLELAKPNYSKSVYISVGIMTVNEETGTVVVKTSGHDYKFSEDNETAYNWELHGDTAHPMLINNKPTMLVKVSKPEGMSGDYKEISGVKYYKIGESYYKATAAESASLTATNIRRGYMDVVKVVSGTDAPKDAEFTYSTTFTTGDKKDYWFSIYDGTGLVKNTDAKSYVTGAEAEVKDGQATGYFYAGSGKTVTIKLQAGWNLRFINLPVDTNYVITETDMPSNFSFKEVKGTKKVYTKDVTNPKEENTGTLGNKSISGKIESNNTVYNVTFTNDYTKTHIDLKKIWDDNNNQDGVRPNSVSVTVVGEITLDDGSKSEVSREVYTVNKPNESTTVVENSNIWEMKIDNLDRIVNGKEVSYRIDSETSVPEYNLNSTDDNKQPLINGLEITNYHKISKIDIELKKNWEDNNNQDGIRPKSVDVVVVGTIKVSEKDVEVYNSEHKTTSISGDEKASTWTLKLEDLDEKYDGQIITYKILSEEKVNGYNTKENQPLINGLEVTNYHDLENIKVTVNKVWEDDSNRDGIRPNSLNVTLYNQVTDKPVEGIESVSLNEGNKWTYTFEVPKFEIGSVGIVAKYDVKENNVPSGYTNLTPNKIKKDNDGNFNVTITNKHDNDTTSVKVTKVWSDGENRDNSRPDSIYVQLYASSNAVGEPVELKDGKWSHTFDKLITNESGEPIVYTVKEVGTTIDSEGKEILTVTKNDKTFVYTVSESGSMESGFTITNSYEPEVTKVSVTKVWSDGENRDLSRPDNVSVELFADGSTTNTISVLSDSNSWAHTFENLPKNKDGKEINYTVKEVGTRSIDNKETLVVSKDNKTYNYIAEVSGSMNDGYTITNTYEPEVTEIEITKVWSDDDDRDKLRPDSITVELYANKKSDDDKPYRTATIRKNDNGDWKYTFEDLPKNSDGKEIEYSLNELAIDGYDTEISSIENGKCTITNTHEIAHTNIPVEKIWQDNNNEDKTRPDSITVNLYANKKSENDKPYKTATISENAEGKWIYTFENLPLNENGEEIVYTIDEEAVSGYDKTISKYVIYNSSNKTIPVNGSKTWIDDNDRDGVRPGSITVHLFADGKEIDSKIVSSADDWKYDFGKLPKYNKGQPISYTISEDAVLNYDTEINNLDITNTHSLETVDIFGTKTWEDDSDRDKLRPESIKVNLFANGGEKPVDSTTVTPDENGNWTFEFKNKLKYDNKKEIIYTVEEVIVDGYEDPSISDGDVDSDNNSISFSIVNNHTPEKIKFNITKNWDDYEDEDGVRPESITIHLLADGEEIDSFEMTEENNWTYSSDELPRYKKHDGSEKIEIVYTITEDEIEGYGSTIAEPEIIISEGGKIINNSITNSHMPEITIEGEKFWEDFDNKYDSRPKEITIYLYKKDELFKVIVVSSEKDWKYVIENLDKYDEDGEITYTIKEEMVEGYETTIDGFNIVNKLIWNVGDGELPPQTGFEIKFNNVLYIIISGILFILGKSLIRKIEE